MKGKKGRISLILGWVFLLATLFVTSLMILPYFSISFPLLQKVTDLLGRQFSFSLTLNRVSLLPLALLLCIWTILFFVHRGRKRCTFFLFPLTLVMTYTLYTLAHLLQGSNKPLFAPYLLSSSQDLRQASLKVVFAFLIETFIFIAGTLIGDALDRYRIVKLEKQERKQKELAEKALKPKKQRLFAKRRKQEAKASEAEEEETVVLEKKKVDAIPVIDDVQPVQFPPAPEVPALESLSKKRKTVKTPSEKDVIEVDEILVKGKVSIGALQTLTEERKRNNGLSYLERKQRELQKEQQAVQREQQPAKPQVLSGFLQGALEAVGKAENKPVSKRSDPQGKIHSMLAEAVFQQQTHQEPEKVVEEEKPLSIKEKILSVRYDSELEKPVRVPKTIVEPTFFAEQSTARPINGGSNLEIEEQPVVDVAESDDVLEAASGVGGLASRESGSSALINRARLTYQYPPLEMLVTYPQVGKVIDAYTVSQGEVLVGTLQQFNIAVELTNIVRGPTVTMFELLPAPGVRVNSIVNLSDNIALALAATQVRIVAPIPGKSAVGVEIPNLKRDIIGFREMLPSLSEGLGIPMVLGRNLMGEAVVIDVIKAPHLLIAGSTGSGKSVCVNSLICSVLYRRSPKQVRMILVDPKIVELNIYNGIPHLLTPVITDAKKTLKALDFCLYEMDRRYKLLQGINVRNIVGYNEKIEKSHLARERLPYILVVIDEFADLMHLVGKDMESKVSRLAAMSRAVGIHLVLATQRPSVDVITGVIKNNIPTRIAFAVTSSTDSRIILDEQGADKLLGKGDMLYMSSSCPDTERIQGSFLSDHEVEEVVRFVSSQGEPDYIDESFFEDEEPKGTDADDSDVIDANDDDELMEKALAIVVERKCASASYLQRRLKIGYNRAARLVEQMEELGYVGPPNGSKPRELIKYP